MQVSSGVINLLSHDIVKNVFEERELPTDATVANFATVQAEGKREKLPRMKSLWVRTRPRPEACRTKKKQ